MTTEIGKASLPTIPARSYAQSLEPQARFKHRAYIAFRIEALLDGYWNRRPEDAVRDIILKDWMDALEDFSPEEIEKACKAYLLGQSRARKPKTGDIVELMIAERTELRRIAAHMAPPPPSKPAPATDPASIEERRRKAAEIMARFSGGVSE